jgi:ketosteroid isomerase-like protein
MKTVRFFILLTAMVTVLFPKANAQDKLARDKAVIRAAYEALSNKDWSAFAALANPNYTEVNAGPSPLTGIQAAIELYKQFATGFPDFKVAVNDIVPASAKNTYYVNTTVSGTNNGMFMMFPPTGKSMKFDEMNTVTFDDNGKCLSHEVSRPGETLRQIGYGSFNNPNTATVIALYEKFGKGDVPGILAMSSDDLVFEIQDRMFDSKPRFFKGKAQVASFFQELGSKFQYAKFQPTRFITDGDDVMILVSVEYTLTATGKKYTSEYTHHFKVVNGKVTYFRGVDDFQMMK